MCDIAGMLRVTGEGVDRAEVDAGRRNWDTWKSGPKLWRKSTHPIAPQDRQPLTAPSPHRISDERRGTPASGLSRTPQARSGEAGVGQKDMQLNANTFALVTGARHSTSWSANWHSLKSFVRAKIVDLLRSGWSWLAKNLG